MPRIATARAPGRFGGAAAILALLAACADAGRPPSPVAAPDAGSGGIMVGALAGSMGARAGTGSGNSGVLASLAAGLPRTAVAAILPAQVAPASRDGAYGLLLLRRGEERNGTVCRAFFQRLAPVADPSGVGPRTLAPPAASAREMVRRPTFWLVRRAAIPEGEPFARTCRQLLDDYDWERASGELARLGVGGASGPVLAAYAPRPEADQAIVFDLSRVPKAELGRAFRVWETFITADPAGWSRQSLYLRVREGIRNELIASSDTVLSLVLPRAAVARGVESSADRPQDVVVTFD